MSSRNKSGYDTFLDEFTSSIYVICPACHQQAMVETSPTASRRLTCSHCGFNKVASVFQPSSAAVASDPYFGLPLWLTAWCGNNQLWAYNYEHLRFIREHIDAQLRERNGLARRNQSLGSRLPKWILAKKHRAMVLKAVALLEKL